MYEISPKNILVPILYKTAIPIFINNKNGTKYESNANCNIIKHKITAITTYIITSESDRFLVSINVAVIPLILHLSSVISLIFSTELIVSSDDICSLNVTSIIVLLSSYNLSCTSFGNISFGISVPIISAILITFSTLLISFI